MTESRSPEIIFERCQCSNGMLRVFSYYEMMVQFVTRVKVDVDGESYFWWLIDDGFTFAMML